MLYVWVQNYFNTLSVALFTHMISTHSQKNIRNVNPNLSSYCVLLSVLGPVEYSPMNTWTGYGWTDDWLEGGKTLRQIEDEKTGLYMDLSADHLTPGK